MEIQKVICLSTRHVTEDDMNDALPSAHMDQPVFRARHDYGAFIYIPASQDGIDDLLQACREFGYSESFCKVLQFGFAHGARYVHLDCDGPEDTTYGLDSNDW